MNTGNKINKETFKVTGDWAKQSKTLKETFKNLTDADLKLETGKEHDLLSRIQSRLSKTRDEVIKLLKAGHVPVTV